MWITISKFVCHVLDNNFHRLYIFPFSLMASVVCTTQPTVMDISARTTMNGAAKCDMHCVGRVTQVSRFRVFMFQCSIRCSDTCVLVVLDMRNVEHLLQE